MTTKVVIFSDFDGTMTCENVLTLLYKRFSKSDYQKYVTQWDEGEISTQEEIEACFSGITATFEEMESLLDQCTLRPGIPEFLGYCHEKGYSFCVLSDGLRWYIDYILQRNGLNNILVYANEIFWENGNYRFLFPWFDPRYPLRGTSKATIISQHKDERNKVIFIGDGVNDLEAAKVADFVFARDRLLESMLDQGMKAEEFEDFFEVQRKIDLLDGEFWPDRGTHEPD